MGTQEQMFWTLVGFWAWFLCELPSASAVPLVTEWQADEGDDYTTDLLPWGTDSDYFEPTTLTATERVLTVTEELETGASFTSVPPLGGSEGVSEVPGENTGSVGERSTPSPEEKETSNSVLPSTKDDQDPASGGPSKLAITAPEETIEEATQIPIKEQEVLANANSSSSSLEKGANKATAEVSEETATASAILFSEETPSIFSDNEPNPTPLRTNTYPGATDSVLPTATRDEELLVSTSGVGVENVVSSKTIFPPWVPEVEEPLGAATREPMSGSGSNPTVASWEETTVQILEPNEDTPEPSPDANSEAPGPSLPPGLISGSTDLLPTKEAEDGPTENEAVMDTSGSTSPGDTVLESSKPSELVTIPMQPSPDSEAALGVEPAPEEGRGDMGGARSVTAPNSDAEATAIPISAGPELSLESTVEAPAEEAEGQVDAEASGSSPADETSDVPSGSALPKDAPLEFLDPASEVTAAAPIRLSPAPASSQSPDGSEAGAASAAGEDAEVAEGSGSTATNEGVPFALSSPEQEPAAAGEETPDEESVPADHNSVTASSLNSAMETSSLEPVENESSTKPLPDTEMSSLSDPEDEATGYTQGASGEPSSSTSLSDTPSEDPVSEGEGGDIFPSGVPGKAGSSTKDDKAIPGTEVSSESTTNEVAATTSDGGQREADLLPPNTEFGPATGTQLPEESSEALASEESSSQSPGEDTTTSAPDALSGGGESALPSTLPDNTLPSSSFADAPPNGLPGSLASSQMSPGSDTEVGPDAPKTPEDQADSADVSGEEASSAPSAPKPELPADTGTLEGADVSGDLGRPKAVSALSELVGKVGSTLVSSGTQDEINTIPTEAHLGSEDPKDTSTTSFSGVSDDESGAFTDAESSSPFTAGTGASEAQGSSGETLSSASLSDVPYGSISLQGDEEEPSPSPASEDFSPAPQDTEDGEEGTGLSANDITVTTSSESQVGTKLPFSDAELGPAEGTEPPVWPSEEVSSQSSAEFGEASETNVASGEELLASPGEKSSLHFVSESLGAQPSESSISPGDNGASQPSPDDTLSPESPASQEAQESQDSSSMSGKKTPLSSLATESQSASPVTEGMDNIVLESSAGMGSQPSPDDTATSEGAEDLETSSSVGGEEPPLDSLDAESQTPGTPTREEVSGGLGQEEPSISTEEVLATSTESAASGTSQPSPDDAAAEGSVASDGEGDSEGAETAVSVSSASTESQTSPDGAAASAEDLESSSSESGEELPLDSSALESQTLGTSAGDEVSEGLGQEEPSLSTEGAQAASTESVASGASQSSLDGAAIGGSIDSDGAGESEVSPSLSGKEASLATESQSLPPSSEEAETAILASSASMGSQPSPGGASASEGAEELESSSSVSGEEPALDAVLVDSQIPGPSEGEEVSSGKGKASPSTEVAQADEESQPSPDGAASSEGEDELVVPSGVSGEETSLDSSSTESQTPGTSAGDKVSGGLGQEEPSLSSEGVQTASSESAATGTSQSSSDDAAADGSVASDRAGEPEGSETAVSVSSASTESQTSPVGAAASEEAEEFESSSSVSREEPLLDSSLAESQAPGTSAGDKVSGGLGQEESSLSSEGVQTASSESSASGTSQPSSDDAAADGSVASDRAGEPEGAETAVLVSSASIESQTSPDGAAASEEAEEYESSSSVSREEPLLDSSLAESQAPGTSAGDEVSRGLGQEKPSLSTEGAEATSTESVASGASQPSVDGAATGGSVDSDGAGESEGSPSLSGKEVSLAPSATESQSAPPSIKGAEKASSGSAANVASQPSADDAVMAGSVASDGARASEGAETAISVSSASAESQPSPDGAVAPEGTEDLESSSSVSGEELPLDSSAVESLTSGTSAGDEVSGGLVKGETSLSNEVAGRASSESVASGASQPSVDGSAMGGPVNSDGTGGSEGPSNLSGKESSSAMESQSEAPSPEEAETASSAPSASMGSQPSPDGAAASEGAEDLESNSSVSGEEPRLDSIAAESQTPGTSAGDKVSGGLGQEEPSVSSEEAGSAGSGSSATKGFPSSANTVLSPESVANQLGEESGLIVDEGSSSQSSSADGSVALIHKALGEALESGSTSPDGSLATGRTPGQSSSQPPSGSGTFSDAVSSPDSAAGLGDSVLPSSGQTGLSSSNARDGPDPLPPVAQAGAAINTGSLGSGAGVLGSDTPSAPSSVAGGTKTALSSLRTFSIPLSFGPFQSGVEGTGQVAGASASSLFPQEAEGAPISQEESAVDTESEAQAVGPSLSGLSGSSSAAIAEGGKGSVSGGRGDADSSAVIARQGPSLTSVASEANSPLPDAQPSPATLPRLPAGLAGPGLKAESSLPSSKVPATAEHSVSGKLPASDLEAPSSSEATKTGSSTGAGISPLSPSSSESKPAPGVSKDNASKAKPPPAPKPDARLAVSGVGPLAAKASQTTSKASEKNPKTGKNAAANDGAAKSGRVSTASVTEPAAAVLLFPYGPNANDKEYVEKKVDFVSPLFKPEIGVPLGKTLRDSVYFTDNGQIMFPTSDKDISSYPNPPPKGFDGREKVPMIAVFWDNADFSRGGGTIFYQEYVSRNSAKHPVVQGVEAKIHRYVTSSYSAVWTLKITWVKAQPYPAQKRNGRSNTYQAILTTDGYKAYTLFLYQDGGMQWDYAKLKTTNVLIGYSSGDGYFKNDDLMSKTPAAKYRPDRFEGYGSDVRGLWIYKLDSRVRVNYRRRCLDWVDHEGQPSAWNKGLPPCPCSLQQGESDNRYTRSKKGLLDSRLAMLYSSTPNKYGAGVRCLYNKNNQLVEGHQEKVWKGSRKSSPNTDEELKVYDWCCNQTGHPRFCDKYSQKRPKIGCDGYRPPNRAASSDKKLDSKSEEERGEEGRRLSSRRRTL